MQLCCMAAYVVAFLSTVALSGCRTVSRLLFGSLGALVLLIVGAGLATTLRPIRRSTTIPMSRSRHGRTSCKGGLLPFFLLPNLGLSRAPPNGDWLQAISPRTTHVQGSRQKTPRSGGAVLTPGVSCSDVPASGIKQLHITAAEIVCNTYRRAADSKLREVRVVVQHSECSKCLHITVNARSTRQAPQQFVCLRTCKCVENSTNPNPFDLGFPKDG